MNKGMSRVQHDMTAASQQGLTNAPFFLQSKLTYKTVTDRGNQLKLYLKPLSQ